MSRTCAICADRAASTVVNIDGRNFWVCASCGTEEVPDPPPPPPLRDRVAGFLRRTPGVFSHEIAEGLGAEDRRAKSSVSKALASLVSEGAIRFQGRGNDRLYWPAGDGQEA